MKWNILILMMLMLPLATAYTTVEWSVDNASWNHLIYTNENSIIIEGIAEEGGLNASTDYYFRFWQTYDEGTSDYSYTHIKTQEADTMGAVETQYIIMIVIALVLTYWFFYRKSQILTGFITIIIGIISLVPFLGTNYVLISFLISIIGISSLALAFTTNKS